MLLQISMQFTGVDKFFRGKIYQYRKCIFWKKKVQSTASISPPPPELAFQFTYSSMAKSYIKNGGKSARRERI